MCKWLQCSERSSGHFRRFGNVLVPTTRRLLRTRDYATAAVELGRFDTDQYFILPTRTLVMTQIQSGKTKDRCGGPRLRSVVTQELGVILFSDA